MEEERRKDTEWKTVEKRKKKGEGEIGKEGDRGE